MVQVAFAQPKGPGMAMKPRCGATHDAPGASDGVALHAHSVQATLFWCAAFLLRRRAAILHWPSVRPANCKIRCCWQYFGRSVSWRVPSRHGRGTHRLAQSLRSQPDAPAIHALLLRRAEGCCGTCRTDVKGAAGLAGFATALQNDDDVTDDMRSSVTRRSIGRCSLKRPRTNPRPHCV